MSDLQKRLKHGLAEKLAIHLHFLAIRWPFSLRSRFGFPWTIHLVTIVRSRANSPGEPSHLAWSIGIEAFTVACTRAARSSRDAIARARTSTYFQATRTTCILEPLRGSWTCLSRADGHADRRQISREPFMHRRKIRCNTVDELAAAQNLRYVSKCSEEWSRYMKIRTHAIRNVKSFNPRSEF